MISPNLFVILKRHFWLRRLRKGMTKNQISLRFGRPEKTWNHPTHDVWLFLLGRRGDYRYGHAIVFEQNKVSTDYPMMSRTDFDS